VVIVKANVGQPAVMRLSTQGANESKTFDNAAVVTDQILSFVAGGFTVTNNAAVNGGSTLYHWFAAQCEAADSAVFTYTGDGADDKTVGSFAFTPAFAMGFGASTRIRWRSDQHSGDSSQEHGAASIPNMIQALQAGSIQVGTIMNGGSVVYHFWVVKSGSVATAEYTGDGTDDRDIAHGLGATPILALVQAQTVTNQQLMGRFKEHVGDLSSRLPAASDNDAANWIQSMDATNVRVGSDARVNFVTGSPLYTLVTFGEVSAAESETGTATGLVSA
jgi:hypothetical protein